MVDLVSLLTALRQVERKDAFTMTECIKEVENLTVDRLTELTGAGLKVFTAHQLTNQIVYVPPGWIVCEAVVKGMLVYGVRRTVAVSNLTCCLSYEALLGCMRLGGRDVAKMEQALDMMKSST